MRQFEVPRDVVHVLQAVRMSQRRCTSGRPFDPVAERHLKLVAHEQAEPYDASATVRCPWCKVEFELDPE